MHLKSMSSQRILVIGKKQLTQIQLISLTRVTTMLDYSIGLNLLYPYNDENRRSSEVHIYLHIFFPLCCRLVDYSVPFFYFEQVCYMF